MLWRKKKNSKSREISDIGLVWETSKKKTGDTLKVIWQSMICLLLVWFLM